MGSEQHVVRRPKRAALLVPMLWAAASAARVDSSLWAHEAIATELTWTRNVSRIFYSRCASCHRSDGSAPMPLTTYAEVRPWAKAIKHEVLARRMPPWAR